MGINPDNVQNVVYQDFQAEENPMTHEVIRTAGVIAAPVAAKPQINQTVMPGLQFPMFQAPLTANIHPAAAASFGRTSGRQPATDGPAATASYGPAANGPAT